MVYGRSLKLVAKNLCTMALELMNLFSTTFRDRPLIAWSHRAKVAETAEHCAARPAKAQRNPTLDFAARIPKALNVLLPKLIEDADHHGRDGAK